MGGFKRAKVPEVCDLQLKVERVKVSIFGVVYSECQSVETLNSW